MYTLHTTDAFVLAGFPEGESGKTYKLFTRDFGVVYARGQGVRELKSRNRYALRTHMFCSVTLVRGKGGWRITGAHEQWLVVALPARRVLRLVNTLFAQEDPSAQLFDELHSACTYSWGTAEAVRARVEAIVVLRLLHTLGYVAQPTSALVASVLSAECDHEKMVAISDGEHRDIVRTANVAIQHAHGR